MCTPDPQIDACICSVIASVQELMRAEALDQIAWTERRRRRLKAGGGDTNLPRAIAMKSSSSSPKTARTEERQRRQPKRRIGRKSAIAAKIQARAQAALDPTQAMIRIGQLKSTLTKAPDPPAAAAELAMLYLVLSDQRGALKSFQLAVKPSPGELGWVTPRRPGDAPINHEAGAATSPSCLIECK